MKVERKLKVLRVEWEKQVYVNNVGKINEVISQENPVSGNDVYLSIDIIISYK